MIECIFTIDYELYGNGEGSLKELVYEPAERLMAIFQKRNARFVPFVEVSEMEMIESQGTDSAIALVKKQIKDFHKKGFELGLHLHPHWYNGRYENGRWRLNYSEYNLCTLPQERIIQIVDRALAYFRNILGDDFTPFSFRAGNWLFQPTQPAAKVLAERGIKVDSSVFKGGLQHQHKLDYRLALRNGYFWRFMDQVDMPKSGGALLELPIYTQMVPFWKMLTSKRLGIQQKVQSAAPTDGNKRSPRLLDFLRFLYPLKFDFCRMSINELTHMINTVIREDNQDPTSFRPIVAIGHTKDLVDFDTVESFLFHLEQKGIRVSTFGEIYSKCKG